MWLSWGFDNFLVHCSDDGYGRCAGRVKVVIAEAEIRLGKIIVADTKYPWDGCCHLGVAGWVG